jgi:hypothetical protein
MIQPPTDDVDHVPISVERTTAVCQFHESAQPNAEHKKYTVIDSALGREGASILSNHNHRAGPSYDRLWKWRRRTVKQRKDECARSGNERSKGERCGIRKNLLCASKFGGETLRHLAEADDGVSPDLLHYERPRF